MKPKVYQFEDPEKQTVYFRGGIVIYDGISTAQISCKQVRKNTLQAMSDAKAYIKKLKHEKQSSPHSL